MRWARTIATPSQATFGDRVLGHCIQDVRRRGKWLIFVLDGEKWLLTHLRMSGRLMVEAAGAPEDPHTRVLFHLDDGLRLCFSDPRRFGRMALVDDPETVLGQLGPEPLDPALTPQKLREMLQSRRARLKPLLMDQRFLAGLGNIYADEVLWEAGLHPLRRSETVSEDEAERLLGAIRRVLEAAIAHQGTTLQDQRYLLPDGRPGAFARHLAAYGREGQPCPRCGAPIVRIRLGGRGAHFCPLCQPLVP